MHIHGDSSLSKLSRFRKLLVNSRLPVKKNFRIIVLTGRYYPNARSGLHGRPPPRWCSVLWSRDTFVCGMDTVQGTGHPLPITLRSPCCFQHFATILGAWAPIYHVYCPFVVLSSSDMFCNIFGRVTYRPATVGDLARVQMKSGQTCSIVGISTACIIRPWHFNNVINHRPLANNLTTM